MRQTLCWLLALAVLSCGSKGDQAQPGSRAVPGAAGGAGVSPMIEIRPTSTRFVDIVHTRWDRKWAVQLPEAIASRERIFMDSARVEPDWQPADGGAWRYVWRSPSPPSPAANPRGRQQRPPRYAAGLELEAEIAPIGNGVRLALTLTNESAETFFDVNSEGGCLQARSAQFRGRDEIARTFVMIDGRMTSLAELDRTAADRCHYRTAFKAERVGAAEGTWPTSADLVDLPAIIGRAAKKGERLVLLGYQGAWSAMQNADQHHCIHSNPYFGDLEPGESVTRMGFILFGRHRDRLVRRMESLLGDGAPPRAAS